MAEKNITSKLADIPLARPGFDSLSMSAPLMMQMNPQGKWKTEKPDNLDEMQLKAFVQHLISTNAASAVKSYCSECAAENKRFGGVNTKEGYIPVIIMPLSPDDQCPFDMDCQIQRLKDAESTPKGTKVAKAAIAAKDSDKGTVDKKPKKRVCTMQRLTDFDLMSQW